MRAASLAVSRITHNATGMPAITAACQFFVTRKLVLVYAANGEVRDCTSVHYNVIRWITRDIKRLSGWDLAMAGNFLRSAIST